MTTGYVTGHAPLFADTHISVLFCSFLHINISTSHLEMKSAVLWDVMHGSCKNRCFIKTYVSETSVLTRIAWRHIRERGILNSHRREILNLTNLKMMAERPQI
jgi:hypothetical protein